MAATYTTKDGDTVDYIAWKFYGSTANKVVEDVLEANRGLADVGPILAAGRRIALPEATSPVQIASVKLWD